MQVLVSREGIYAAIRFAQDEIDRFDQVERVYGVVFPGEVEVLQRRIAALRSEL